MKTKDYGCKFCSKFDFSTVSLEIKEDGQYIVLGSYNTRFPADKQFNFCPNCGRPLKTKISYEKNTERLKNATIYCFAVKLEYLDEYKAKCNDYTVNLKVLAEDQFKARKMLEEWLSKPEQTGWKYKKWLGITPIPATYA